MTRAVAVALLLLALPARAVAQADGDGGALDGVLVTLVTVGALAVVPVLFVSATSFVKIAVVFSLLRSAFGAVEVPSGTVITAFAGILTLYVMAPVGGAMADAAGPALARVNRRDPLADPAALQEVLARGSVPLAAFLERNAGARERALFLELARDAQPPEVQDEVSAGDFLVVLPAFLVTELTEAFQLGFLVLLPFLVLELVVANVLLSLGMQALNPSQVSLPFKLLLFVLADGWYLLSRAVVVGYA